MKTYTKSFRKEALIFRALPEKRHSSLFPIKQSFEVDASCVFPLIFVPTQGAGVDDLKFESLLPYVVTSFEIWVY